MAFLRHFTNGVAVGAVELNDSVTIGRARDNTVVLDDGTVSAHHAEVLRKEDDFVIIDCDSTNGLYVSGQRVAYHKFSDGDVVTLGTSEFEYVTTLPQDFSRTLKIKKSWIPGIYYTT